MAHLLPSIIKSGIMPGGVYVAPGAREDTGERLTSNLCAYLPTDPRNTAVGRPGVVYDAVIILKRSVLTYLHIMMSHNGVLSTEDTISWRYIDMIYITPRGAGRWVLFDHLLASKTSEGYQEPEGTIPGMTMVR
eukprot:7172379-Heterocapsa_arctica.AAC.1